jgi:hypothetical protein
VSTRATISGVNPLLQRLMARYMKPAGEDGSDTSGSDSGDRGDDWTPTDDDAADLAARAEDKGDDKGDKDEEDKPAPKKKPAKAAAKEESEEESEVEEEEEEEEEEGEGKDKNKRKDTRMPLSRHKKILEKERAERAEVERRLQAYEQGDRVAATNEAIKKTEDKILALDKEYAKLMVDGDHEKAAEKRAEIRKLENDIIEQKSDLKAQAATARAIEKVRYDTTVERLEAAYPQLNPEHDDFDGEAAQDVLDLASTYRSQRNMTPAEAIQKAAKKLLGAETKKQEQAVDTKARVDKDEVKAEEKKQAKEEQRRRNQVEKNLDANKRQPADTSRVGADSDKAGGGLTDKDVLKMSHDDFTKLDEATLSRLRGDTLA